VVSLTLYPTIAGDGEGFLPKLGDVIPILAAPEADAEGVITEPTEPTEPVEEVVDEVENLLKKLQWMNNQAPAYSGIVRWGFGDLPKEIAPFLSLTG